MTTAAENIIIQQNAQIIALLERLTTVPAVAPAAVATVEIPDPRKQTRKERQAAAVYAWKEQCKKKLNPVMAAILDKHYNKKYLK